jgi:hypothetical protein
MVVEADPYSDTWQTILTDASERCRMDPQTWRAQLRRGRESA